MTGPLPHCRCLCKYIRSLSLLLSRLHFTIVIEPLFIWQISVALHRYFPISKESSSLKSQNDWYEDVKEKHSRLMFTRPVGS